MDDHAPTCEWCQATALAASALRDKKLGRHERRLLREASEPGKPATLIVPPGPSQADQTATRRAVASLLRSGLILVEPGAIRVTPDDDPLRLLPKLRRKYARLRRASRTPLGAAVVEVFGRELQRGARIRWVPRLDALTDAACARCPHR